MFSSDIFLMMGQGFLESLYMTLVSTLVAYLIGVPIGLFLVVTDANGLKPNPAANTIVGGIVNLLRSVPFVILMVTVTPLARLIVGTGIGSSATIVSLVIAAAPFVARMVESSVNEVDRGVVEASISMGASPMQVVCRVLLPEAVPSLIVGAAIATTTILGYSAMAGFVGGGGLGTIATNYGYYRKRYDIMLAMVVLLVLIVQVFQGVGTAIAKKSDKRIR